MATRVRPSEKKPEPHELPPSGGAEPAQRSRWWLRSSDQLVLASVTGVALLLLALYWLDMSGGGRRPIEIERLPLREFDYRVDPNSANWVQWAQLPGLGEILAKRIVEDRALHGPFRVPEDLLRVNGIGPKKLADLRPFLEIAAPHRSSDDQAPNRIIESIQGR